MLAPMVRIALVVIGLLAMLGGLATVVAVDAVGGLWVVATGGFLVVVAVIERQRYRSEAAERTNEAPGPGGGELSSAPVDPRFRPTTEVFVDPTTGRRMRVLVDPSSGERRYIAEG